MGCFCTPLETYPSLTFVTEVYALYNCFNNCIPPCIQILIPGTFCRERWTFFVVLGIELMVSRQAFFILSMSPVLFALLLVFFQIGSCTFIPVVFRMWFSCLYFLSNWDNRHATPLLSRKRMLAVVIKDIVSYEVNDKSLKEKRR
jgi:hypothetical protein